MENGGRHNLRYIFLIITFILFASKIFALQNKDELIVGVKNTPPFIIKNADGNYSGVSVDLWKNIADKLNLKYKFKEYNLQGLLNALENNKIDVCINPLTVTSDRIKKIDFTQPFYITNLAIASSVKQESTIILFLKNLFSFEFLGAVLGLFVVLLILGIFVWFFERKNNTDEFEKGPRGIWSGIWWSAVTMTTVGYGDKAPKSTAGKIIGLIWMFASVIIISGFTAGIAASLTVNSLGYKIKGPEDLVQFSIGTIKGSTSEEYLSDNNVKTKDFENTKEGLQAAADKKIDAFVYDEPILKYFIKNGNFKNEITLLPYKFDKQYYSFSLPKNSRLLDEINPVLLDELSNKNFNSILEEYSLQ